jgi:hypothetical protein
MTVRAPIPVPKPTWRAFPAVPVFLLATVASDGTARLSATFVTAGTYSIIATFTPASDDYKPSTSSPIVIVVNVPIAGG